MKKLLIIGFALIFILSGCKPTTTTECQPGQELIGKDCVDIVVCDTDQIKVDGVCVDIVTCDEGYILEGDTCVVVDTRTDLEKAFEQSIDIDNYTMNITVTEGIVTSHFTMQFDGNTSSFTVGGNTEYYERTLDVCTKVTIQAGTIISETIDCLDDSDSRFQFFHGFEIEWFTETEDGYTITEGNYIFIDNFFRTTISQASVSDFVLTLEDDYFSTFDFIVTTPDTMYEMSIAFSNINDTVITIPQE